MTWIYEAIEKARPSWHKSLDLPFLREMRDGSLPKEVFDYYLYNDIAYLFHYVKICGKAIYQAKSNEDIALYLSLIDISFDLELNMRFEETDKEGVPLHDGAQAYITFMEEIAQDATNERIFLALLQCMLSYQYVFTEMAEGIPDLESHPYYFFIKDYLGEAYTSHCQAWISYAEEAYRDLEPGKAQDYLDLFLEGSHMEYRFWESSYRK